ncbi:MAG TPA: hypothetical protein VFW90_03410 [Candidatus Saccharimonadales bacterium]|nr:hypothetical protein [Candidatus Saccharimonadales bacterium]
MPPNSPNPDFDFMLKDSQPARRGLPLPSLNLPKPAKIILVAVGILFILLIIYAVLAGRGNVGRQSLIDVVQRGQEIIRVTGVIQDQLQDPDTQALAATVSSTLSSEQKQLVDYLASNHIKVSTSQLDAHTNKSTDSSLQSAAQNNNLDSTYVNYLNSGLSKYAADIQTAYKSAGPKGKQVLSDAFDSVKVLSSSPPLKS